MPRSILAVAVAVAAVVATACAHGFEQPYADARPSLGWQGDRTVAVVTHDRRADLSAGEIEPSTSGYDRSLWGFRRPVRVDAGMTLADAITQAVCAALAASGFRPIPVGIDALSSPEDVRARIAELGADRGLVVAIHEWRAATWFGTDVDYDVTLAVLNRWSESLRSAHVQGTRSLGGDLWDPAEHARAAVPEALEEILGALLADPALSAALR